MMKGRLRGRRILVENEADASTLRNKGYKGRNIGQGLSLDLMTAFDLVLRKRMEVRKQTSLVTAELLWGMMSPENKKTAMAFHFLKIKGMRPIIRSGKIYSLGERIFIYGDNEIINFEEIRKKSSTLLVTDSEGNCLLYKINRIGKTARNTKGKISNFEIDSNGSLREFFNQRGMRLESGLKFGTEFRVYEGGSSHARYLMTIEDETLARNLVARVRISQSVRKTFLQVVYDKDRREYRIIEIKWNRL